MAITRSNLHKRRATGGRRHPHQKKRKFLSGRAPALTKLLTGKEQGKRIHLVRGRGGNLKYRALRLDSGNFAWGSEAITKKTRILDVVYNASNNELVRTQTLVKRAIVIIDATPFRTHYETHFKMTVPKKGEDITSGEPVKVEGRQAEKYAARQADAKKNVEPAVLEQLRDGKVMAAISSRPGQSGRADGYILEGAELEFYKRKLALKKAGGAAAKK